MREGRRSIRSQIRPGTNIPATRPAVHLKQFRCKSGGVATNRRQSSTIYMEIYLRKKRRRVAIYEYARTSQLFRKARSSFLLGLRTKLPRKGRPWRAVVAREAVIAADLGGLLREPMGLEIVSCHRFPDKPWQELTTDQRQDICVHFVLPRIIPVVTDSFILKSAGVLEKFGQQAESDSEAWKQRNGRTLRGRYPAVVGDESYPIRHASFGFPLGQPGLRRKIRLRQVEAVLVILAHSAARETLTFTLGKHRARWRMRGIQRKRGSDLGALSSRWDDSLSSYKKPRRTLE